MFQKFILQERVECPKKFYKEVYPWECRSCEYFLKLDLDESYNLGVICNFDLHRKVENE